ncbi:hypothetical protein BLNAU_11573 [Blattamonas nauphoetae]|uniref:Uncharacterized protein n=1 Tax=Blattamonas nauphoetae TaxID=2049346 RepID=A0ABQ9XRA2_9EUKA|nr:hypothetical protein BLNAU_11573 [Blattamonas nauphoetae]
MCAFSSIEILSAYSQPSFTHDLYLTGISPILFQLCENNDPELVADVIWCLRHIISDVEDVATIFISNGLIPLLCQQLRTCHQIYQFESDRFGRMNLCVDIHSNMVIQIIECLSILTEIVPQQGDNSGIIQLISPFCLSDSRHIRGIALSLINQLLTETSLACVNAIIFPLFINNDGLIEHVSFINTLSSIYRDVLADLIAVTEQAAVLGTFVQYRRISELVSGREVVNLTLLEKDNADIQISTSEQMVAILVEIARIMNTLLVHDDSLIQQIINSGFIHSVGEALRFSLKSSVSFHQRGELVGNEEMVETLIQHSADNTPLIGWDNLLVLVELYFSHLTTTAVKNMSFGLQTVFDSHLNRDSPTIGSTLQCLCPESSNPVHSTIQLCFELFREFSVEIKNEISFVFVHLAEGPPEIQHQLLVSDIVTFLFQNYLNMSPSDEQTTLNILNVVYALLNAPHDSTTTEALISTILDVEGMNILGKLSRSDFASVSRFARSVRALIQRLQTDLS